jgi:hypothetical protein
MRGRIPGPSAVLAEPLTEPGRELLRLLEPTTTARTGSRPTCSPHSAGTG